MLQLPPSGQPHYSVAFSPDGRWLAAGGLASGVDLWDLHAPSQPARRVGPFAGVVIRVQFVPGERLVVATTEQVTVFDFGTRSVALQLDFPRVHRAACSPDGHTLATVGGLEVALWTVLGPAFTRRQHLATAGATDVAYVGDSRLVVARARDPGGRVEVFEPGRDTGSGFPVPGRPHRVACSADGELAATLALGNLSVWHLPTRAAVADRYTNAHGGWLSVAFAPHGRRVVTGGLDGAVAMWDATGGGPPVRTFQWGVGPVYAVAFDRDGQCAAAAGHAGALVWDVDD